MPGGSTFQDTFYLQRRMAGGSGPNAGFGSGLSFQLEGFTDQSYPVVGGVGMAWETNQVDDTNARDSYMTFSTAVNNVVTEKMRLTSSGRIGLGTTWTPSANIEIYNGGGTADIRIDGSAASYLRMASTSNPAIFPNTITSNSADLTISSDRNVGINDLTPDTTFKVVGSLCVKSDDLNCAGAVAGTVYANNTTVQAADYAEYFLSEEELVAGQVVGLNSQTGLARSYRSGDKLLGIVSTSPGVVGNSEIKDKKSVLVALMGQVPFRVDDVRVNNAVVSTLDGKQIGYLLASGHVYINVSSTQNEDKHQNSINEVKRELAEMKSYICHKEPTAPFCK